MLLFDDIQFISLSGLNKCVFIFYSELRPFLYYCETLSDRTIR